MAASEGTNPLSKTFVNISLTAGLNRKRDAHQLQNGELLTAENVSYSQVEGQICKRNGFAPVTPQGAPFQGGPFKAIGCRDNTEPLILGANTLNKYNGAKNLSTFLPTPTQGRLSVKQIVGSTGQSQRPWPPSHASCATDGTSYVLVTWEEPNESGAFCYYGIQDLATGGWIIKPIMLKDPIGSRSYNGKLYTTTAFHSPKATYSNGFFFISVVWCGQNFSNSIMSYQAWVGLYSIALTNLAAPLAMQGPFLIAASTSSTWATSPSPYSYDFAMGQNRFILAVAGAAGPRSIEVQVGTVYAIPQAATSNTVVYSAGTNVDRANVSVRCDFNSQYPFAMATSDGVTLLKSDGTYGTAIRYSNGTSLRSPCDVISYGSAGYAFLQHDASAAPALVCQFSNANAPNEFSIPNGAIRFTPPVTTQFLQVLSRLFRKSASEAIVYCWVGAAGPTEDSVYNSAFLVEFNLEAGTATAICRTLYLASAHVTGGDVQFPTDVVQISGTKKFVTYLTAITEKSSGKDFHGFGTLSRVEFDFQPDRNVQMISLPTGGVMIAGALPLYYDGATVSEFGFSSAPTGTAMGQTVAPLDAPMFTVSKISAGPTGVSGLEGGASAVTPSGFLEYYYTICFVRRDAYGNVNRSAPSPVITVPCPNLFNWVNWPALTYNGGENVMVEYYRSTQNIPGTYYFIGQVANGVAFVDKTPDGTQDALGKSITANRTVYTNSGELPNDPPPPVHHAAMSESRVYLIPSDNRNVIWYSKQFAPARSVEFSANLTMSEGLNSGQFTALAVLDDKLIIFKNDQVLYTYGTGPDNGGSNGAFAPFVRIASDVGCIEAASVCVIPEGVVFKSRRGIELLNRSLQVQYIGGKVEPLVQTNGPLSSVVVMPNFTELRFIPSKSSYTSTYLGKTQTIAPSVLVYDYAGKRWSTYSNMASVQAVNINNEYWWISADGSLVNRETPGKYLDNGETILMTLETPEIPCGSAGSQGWGRIYRMALLGDFYSAHKLLLSLAYDHQAAYTDTVTFDTKSGLITGDTVYQFRCSRLPRSVMQTLRLKIQDTANVGQSCAISNLVLEVATKNGLAHLSPAKTL